MCVFSSIELQTSVFCYLNTFFFSPVTLVALLRQIRETRRDIANPAISQSLSVFANEMLQRLQTFIIQRQFPFQWLSNRFQVIVISNHSFFTNAPLNQIALYLHGCYPLQDGVACRVFQTNPTGRAVRTIYTKILAISKLALVSNRMRPPCVGSRGRRDTAIFHLFLLFGFVFGHTTSKHTNRNQQIVPRTCREKRNVFKMNILYLSAHLPSNSKCVSFSKNLVT